MSTTLDKKLGWGDIMNGALAELKGIFAGTLSDEQKLAQIAARLEAGVADKRAKARKIGGQMRAIADPTTKDLEPLEALKARRAKLVKLGGSLMGQRGAPKKLKAIQDEIKGLDELIGVQQQTYDTLEEAYDVAKTNYQASLEALERVRGQGTAILAALAAHRDAQEMADAARDTESVDVSFMDDLMGELRQVRAETRADAELDADLDAMNDFDIDAALRADEEASLDDSLMAEFAAAANAQAA